MLNPIKFRLLLECYLEYRKTHTVDLGLLMGWRDFSRIMRTEGTDFGKLPAETQAAVFLKACRAAAANTPALDWRLLDVMAAMPPEQLMSDVFPVIDAEPSVALDAEAKLYQNMRKVAHELGKFALSKGISKPYPDGIVETLCLLGFFQHIVTRHPIAPKNALPVLTFLDGASFYSELTDCFRLRLSALISSEFAGSIEYGSDLYHRMFDDRKNHRTSNGETLIALGRDFQYRWILEAIGDKDPVAWIVSIPTEYHAVAHKQLYKKLLEAAERASAALKPMVEFCSQETAYIRNAFRIGSCVRHVKFGEGTVAKNTGKYVAIDFPDGVQRRFLLLHTVLKERLTVDTEEFHDRLFFSCSTLKNLDFYAEQYELASAQLQELSDHIPPLPRLLAMKPVNPDVAWLAQRRYMQK